jgi:hypothetical protein
MPEPTRSIHGAGAFPGPSVFGLTELRGLAPPTPSAMAWMSTSTTQSLPPVYCGVQAFIELTRGHPDRRRRLSQSLRVFTISRCTKELFKAIQITRR